LATTRHSGESRNPLDNTVGLDTGLRRYDVRKFPQLKSIILGNRFFENIAGPKA
jgi:hypothetical protein